MSNFRRKVFLLFISLAMLGQGVMANSDDVNKSVGTAAGRVFDLILSDSGLVTALGKSGLRGESANQVKNFVSLSLKSLGVDSAVPTKRELIIAFKRLPRNGEDGKKTAKLLQILNKRESELTKGEFIEVINDFIYMANRYGTRATTVLACSACVNSNLSENGIKYTMETLKSKSAQDILSTLPTNPKALETRILQDMRSLKLTSYTDFYRHVAPEEERALALFLGLAKSGSKSERALAKEILSVSKFDRRGKVFFGNKLWRLFSDNISSAEADGWSRLIKEVKKDPEYLADNDLKKAIFKNWSKKADANPQFADELDYLKKNNCFFD